MRLAPVLLMLVVAGACSGGGFSSTPSAAGRGGAGGKSSSGGSSGGGATSGEGGTTLAGRGGSASGSGPLGGGGTLAGSAGAGGGSSGAVAVAGGGATGGGGAGGSGVAGEAGMGMAGGGGTCSCAPGQYCRAGKCYACADLSQLDFAAPEEILDYPSGDLRFPRPAEVPGSLFFTLVTSTVSELWYAPDVASSPGAALDNAAMRSRAALDYVGDPGGLGFDVLFGETASSGSRVLRAAPWQAGALGAVTDAAPPLDPSGFDDYSVAFAGNTKHAYWMTTSSGSPALMHGTLGGSASLLELKVPAEVAVGKTCPRQGDDATPWVTPDGSLLLFSALPVDATCAPVDGAASDLYVAPLSPTTGLPLVTAVPITGVNTSSDESSETDASFTADLCTLYFASDGGNAQGHDFRLYRAARR